MTLTLPRSGTNGPTTTTTLPDSQLASMPPMQQPPLMPMPTQRMEIACMFVVEGTARMKPYLPSIIESFLEPLLRKLQTPQTLEKDDKKIRLVPFLKCGLVIFGDYEPRSMVPIVSSYFTSDLKLFQSLLRSINCVGGGILRNATAEGLVTALEFFDKLRQELGESGQDPVKHCILVTNSQPHECGTRLNHQDKYDSYSLTNIADDMRKADIHLSLIAPRKGYTRLESLVDKVNLQKTEIYNVQEGTYPDYVVKLAGVTLPGTPTSQSALANQIEQGPRGSNVQKRLSDLNNNAATSVQSTPDSAKRRRRENVPSQIDLPKAILDSAKFAQLAQKQYNAAVAAASTSATATASIIERDPQTQETNTNQESSSSNSIPQTATSGSPMSKGSDEQPGQAVPMANASQTESQPQALPETQPQKLWHPQQSLSLSHVPSESPQTTMSMGQHLPVQSTMIPQPMNSVETVQATQPQTHSQTQTHLQQQAQIRAVNASRLHMQTQFKQLLDRRNYIRSLSSLTPHQQLVLQETERQLQNLFEQIRMSEQIDGAMANGTTVTSSTVSAAVALPTSVAVTASVPASTPVANGAIQTALSIGMSASSIPLATNMPATQYQSPIMQVTHNIPGAVEQSTNPLLQQRSDQVYLPSTTSTLQQQLLLAAQMNRAPLQQMDAIPGNRMQPARMTEQALSNQSTTLLQSSRSPQSPQQPGNMQTPPIWTGKIVWYTNPPNGNGPQEFGCHCGAFAMALKGKTVGIDDYNLPIWPQQLQIVGRYPSNLDIGKSDETLCEFRTLETSTANDRQYFALLCRNLEQKKYMATIIFNRGQREQHCGIVLTYYLQKLVGVVFTQKPIPFGSNTLGQSQASNPNMTSAMNGINPTLLNHHANNPNMTPTNLMNINRPLLQLMLQQQQQQQQQQQTFAINTFAIGNTLGNGISGVGGVNNTSGVNGINGMNGINGFSGISGMNGANGFNGINGVNGIRPGLNPNSLLVSNINISNPSIGGMNMGTNATMMSMNAMAAMDNTTANIANMNAQTLNDLRMMIMQQRQAEQHQPPGM